MNSRTLRRGSLAGAAALVLTTLAAPLLAAPALAAPGDGGTVVVSFVDQYGRPIAVVPTLENADSSEQPDGGGQALTSTATFSKIKAGGWSLYSISGWGGLVCSGIAPCPAVVNSAQPPTYTPVITVADDKTSTFTQVVPVPSITGSDVNGSALSVALPQGFSDLQAATAGSGGPAIDPTPTVQWQRGTAPITGAPTVVGTPYTTVPADGGQAVTARLTANPSYSGIFLSAFGKGIDPLVTNAITVRPFVALTTKTKVKAPRSLKPRERATLVIKVTTTAGTVTGGTVLVKVAKVVKSATVTNGKALVTLPGLARGLQKIKVSYAGATTFAPSKAKPVKIKVG